MKNPQIKFQPDTLTRLRAQEIAEWNGLGYNDRGSVNELAKLVVQQFSLVRKGELFLALAALKPFQRTSPFTKGAFGPSRSKKVPE